MSKNIYPLFIATLFFSCSNYLPYSSASQPKSITDIPLKPSGATIDCFFNNQTPAKPFYKVNVVEVTGAANVSYDDLLISLKNKAKQQGLDGVMILDKQQEIGYENLNEKITVKDTSVSYYRQLAVPYQKLSAVGIKYAENINYLDTIIKTTTFQFADSSSNLGGVVNFDFYGNPVTIENRKLGNFYWDSIEPFDINKHLHNAVKGWQYKMDDVLTDEVIAFKKEANGMELISVKIDSRDVNKFRYTLPAPTLDKAKKYTLQIERDLTGKLVKKTLYQKNKIAWVEEIYYSNNTITGFKRYRFNNNKLELIFSATNLFYSANDLPKPL
jgi:hypothetical protein